MGNVQQLLSPTLYGGTWGEDVIFALGDTPTAATVGNGVALPPSSGSYGGGGGALALVGSNLIEVGTSGIFQHVLSAGEQAVMTADSAHKVGLVKNRMFQVVNWYQISM